MEMSRVMYLAPGVDSIVFHNTLMVGKSALGALGSLMHRILSPPTVRRDLCFLSLGGL